MKKATLLEVLEFIKKREVVTPTDLMEKFRYTCGGAYSTLGWLKREGFITNDVRGEWTITDKGMKRLIYYGRL